MYKRERLEEDTTDFSDLRKRQSKKRRKQKIVCSNRDRGHKRKSTIFSGMLQFVKKSFHGISEAFSMLTGVSLSKEGTDQAEFHLSKWFIVPEIAIVVLSLYMGGFTGILINPYRYGGSIGIFHAVWVVAHFQVAWYAFLFYLLLFSILGLFLFVKAQQRIQEDDRNFMFSKKGAYGTSRFAIPKQYGEFLDVVDNALETDGIIIGKTLNGKQVVAIPKNSPYNRNICVCGSQGTNKSIAFARNMIIQCAVRKESFVVTDPKSELFEDTVYYLKQEGYEVYQWNLIDHWNSNGWDVLQEISGENELEYVDVLCNTIIKNTAGTDEGDFFDKIETVLLKALILYVVKEYPKEERTLGNVYNMLLQESAESLDMKFSVLPVTHPAFGAYNLFSKSPTNKGNAILGLGARLNIFAKDSVQKITGATEIDISSIAKKKTAVFCIASDSNTTYSMLNALFISMLFIKLMAYADSTLARKCDIPVHIILDEFPNIGVIDEFKQKEATARSRDIGIDILFQNIPQMQNRYPDGVWEELIGGCDFRILLGCNELTTATYYSELSGMASIEVDTERKNLSTIRMTDIVPEVAQSASLGQRALYLPDEILRMDSDELLFFVRGQLPIRLKKFKYYEHPEALKFRQIKTSEIIPEWREDVSEKEKRANTLENLVNSVSKDENRLTVKDTKKWGMQRTNLIHSLEHTKEKYLETRYFPNGHKFFSAYGEIQVDYKESVENEEVLDFDIFHVMNEQSEEKETEYIANILLNNRKKESSSKVVLKTEKLDDSETKDLDKKETESIEIPIPNIREPIMEMDDERIIISENKSIMDVPKTEEQKEKTESEKLETENLQNIKQVSNETGKRIVVGLPMDEELF